MTDKKLRILQATQKLITRQGYEHLTISRIAKECGIGKGTVYEYFDSKEALLNQALSHYARLECDVICAPLPETLSLSESIHTLVLRLCRLFERNTAILSMLWSDLQQQGLPKSLAECMCQTMMPLRDQYLAFVHRLCRRALLQGELCSLPDDFEIGYIGFGLASYLSLQFRTGVPVSEQLADRCTEMVLRQLSVHQEALHA